MPIRLVRGFLLATGLGLTALSAAADFTTRQFDVRIQIRPDGGVNVTEEIAVRFTRPRHGLVRKLPQVTEGATSRRYVEYRDVSVKVNTGGGWAPEPVATRPSGGDFELRIGSARVSHVGNVRYRLAYRIGGAITPQSSPPLGLRSEFYWNLFPTSWATEIPSGMATVVFPPLKPGPLKAKVVGGAVGSRNDFNLRVGQPLRSPGQYRATLERSGVNIRLDGPLKPGHTVTLAVSLPGKTVVAGKPQIQPKALRRGMVRSDDSYPSTPYYPSTSESDTPPSLPWQSDGSSVFNSPILQINPLALILPILVAIGGAVMMRSGKSKPPLVVQFDPPTGLSAAESGYLHDMQFEPRDIVAGMLSLAQKGAARIEGVQADKGFTLWLLNNPVAAAKLTTFESHLFATFRTFGPWITPETLRGNFTESYMSLRSGLSRELTGRGYLQMPTTKGGAQSAAFYVLLILVTGFAFCNLGLLAAAGGVIGLIILATNAPQPSRLTPAGEEAVRHLNGFREFIARANVDELRQLGGREPLQALYERLMPYAMAFGLMREWSRAFDGLDIHSPEWFATDAAVGWNTVQMTLLLEDTVQEWHRSITPPSAQSTSSGDSDWMNRSTSSFGTGSDFSSGGSSFSSSDSGSSGGGSISSGGGGGGGGGDSW